VKKICISFGLIVLSASAVSIDFFPEDSRAEAKTVMKNVYESYVKIIPYIYSSEKVMDISINEDEKVKLINNLTDLSKYFKESKHDKLFQTPALESSLLVINDHLKNTISYVKSGNFVFAQKRLNEIGSLCISCHTQLPVNISKESFGYDLVKEKRMTFDSDYSYANYLYMVRDFNESKKYFEKSIESSLGSSKTMNKIIPSLRKIVSIDTKVQFNYVKAISLLGKWSTDSRLLSSDREIVMNWKRDLLSWKGFDVAKIESIPSFIKNNLMVIDKNKEILISGDKDMTLLISSGVLSKYFIDNPNSKQAPEILFWMAIAERQLSQSFFFSLGDTYLKNCIRNYPQDPFAVKCYRELALGVTASFSGSGGTNIPTEEKKELHDLKKMLKK
jgi:hypothetical protein